MALVSSRSWVLVTGAAGFIGSNLSTSLLNKYNVIGVDNFHNYYQEEIKRKNLKKIQGANEFVFLEKDITNFGSVTDLPQFKGIFHLAAQPGVRDSWEGGFRSYAINNVLGTQQILDLAIKNGASRFVYSSSSSVYGETSNSPTGESEKTSPISPYGVSKLTGEHLANSYAQTSDLKIRSLRYFTVYGPGQRPDMAIHRLIKCTLNDDLFTQFGDGTQSRDFTYIGDVVEANIRAFETPQDNPSEVYNVGGGEGITLSNLITTIEEIVGKKLRISLQPKSQGDVPATRADISAISKALGWAPRVRLTQGLIEQVNWQRSLM